MKKTAPPLCTLALALALGACDDTPPSMPGGPGDVPVLGGGNVTTTGVGADTTASSGAGPGTTGAATGSTSGGSQPTSTTGLDAQVPPPMEAGPPALDAAVADDATGASGDGEVAQEGGTTGPPVQSAVWIPDPSWDCGMPEGLPPPELGQRAFEMEIDLDSVLEVGRTHLGERRVYQGAGGSIEGEQLDGAVDEYGLGFELTLSNGVREGEEVHMLSTSGGDAVYLRACGLAPDGDTPMRFVPHFEAASSGSASWLNTATLVATREIDAAAQTATFVFYAFEGEAPASTPTLNVRRPDDGSPGATWECEVGDGGGSGSPDITETVLIGSSVRVGQTPAGSRTAIPITGGTFEGDRLEGEVLPGGGDYQLSGAGGFTLDARYVLRASDGEYVIVRNCGPTSALTPHFEARADGPHAWLNEGRFTSSVSPGLGRVTISIYQLD